MPCYNTVMARKRTKDPSEMTEEEIYQAGLYGKNSLKNSQTLEWAGYTFEYEVNEYKDINCESCGQSLVEEDTRRYRIYGTDWHSATYVPDNEQELIYVIDYKKKYGKLPPCKLNTIHVHYGYIKKMAEHDGTVY